MKGSSKKDKETGKYFYILDTGIDTLTDKRWHKKKRRCITKKKTKKCFSRITFKDSYWNIYRTQ